jgi:hypothetical protein
MRTRNVDQLASSKTKNTSKGMSYAEAWRRIKAANNAGFHFEAVTICESIISDRLLSFVAGTGSPSSLTERMPFSRLISEWRKRAGPLPQVNGIDLGQAVDQWRGQRNVIVHGLAKSPPGTPTEDLEAFLLRAREAAMQGAALARVVSRWHQVELKRAGPGMKDGSSQNRHAT